MPGWTGVRDNFQVSTTRKRNGAETMSKDKGRKEVKKPKKAKVQE